MNKKIIILLLAFAVVIIPAVWLLSERQKPAPADTQTSANQSATSSVATSTLPDTAGNWLVYHDPKSGLSFKYPVDFGANVWKPTQWPPTTTIIAAGQDAIASGCPNLKGNPGSNTPKTSGKTSAEINYSLYEGSDIGAGQLYSEYCYVINNNSLTQTIDFIIRSHSACGFGGCGAYCGTQFENECTNLDRAKDIENPIREIIDTVTVNPGTSVVPPKIDSNKPATSTSTSDNTPDNSERFVIAIGQGDVDKIAASLVESGFITDKDSFKKMVGQSTLAFGPGGYKLSKTMSAAEIIETLRSKPYMVWVIIPEGLRKEETANLLATELGWNSSKRLKWLDYTTTQKDYFEGVYFPETYLVPIDEEPAKVAERLQTKFNENFAAYLPEFTLQNIKWTTGLTFASIVQREAANAADMPLIAGILWNRIEQGMALDADATLQYARGDVGNGWWAPISTKDKQIDSPYNTYANKGLPPRPICNPGIAAIEATLNPAKTDCLYYLHDSNHINHCAKTYEEHLENIEKYLK